MRRDVGRVDAVIFRGDEERFRRETRNSLLSGISSTTSRRERNDNLAQRITFPLDSLPGCNFVFSFDYGKGTLDFVRTSLIAPGKYSSASSGDRFNLDSNAPRTVHDHRVFIEGLVRTSKRLSFVAVLRRRRGRKIRATNREWQGAGKGGGGEGRRQVELISGLVVPRYIWCGGINRRRFPRRSFGDASRGP